MSFEGVVSFVAWTAFMAVGTALFSVAAVIGDCTDAPGCVASKRAALLSTVASGAAIYGAGIWWRAKRRKRR